MLDDSINRTLDATDRMFDKKLSPLGCLWERKIYGDEQNDDNRSQFVNEKGAVKSCTYETIFRQFSVKPDQKTFFELCSNALVVVQEISLSSYFIARHQVAILFQTEKIMDQQPIRRLENENSYILLLGSKQSLLFFINLSTFFIYIALVLVLIYSSSADQTNQLNRITKLRYRVKDSLLIAILLRFLSSLLQSLTASYSSDTVMLLAFIGMFFHVLSCDYTYANGYTKPVTTDDVDYSSYESTESVTSKPLKRPPFLGGTFSLNAALFATTLLVGRLNSNAMAYLFMTLAIVIFAFYPETRHAISVSYPSSSSVVLWAITLFTCLATMCLLIGLDMNATAQHLGSFHNDATTNTEVYHYSPIFMGAIILVGVLLPFWKFHIQTSKVHLRGPWDIPSEESMQLDYSPSSLVQHASNEQIPIKKNQ